MTLVSQIITDAYRQSNLLAIGTSPTAAQQTEGLRYLNRIVKSVFGHEVGDPLVDIPLGTNNVQSDIPTWELSSESFVPKNTRVVCNLTSSQTLNLHPTPEDGTRFGIIDVSSNFATHNVVINGNGRKVDGSSSLTLSTNGYNKEWMYRADLGQWVIYASLLSSDQMPFPEEFDDYFVTLLAMRIHPAYAVAIDEQTMLIFNRSRSQLRARYHQSVTPVSELGFIYPYWGSYDTDNSEDLFNRGTP